MRFQSGQYLGDGNPARTISLTPGFGTPNFVVTKCGTSSRPSRYKSTNYAGPDSRRLSSSGETNDGITALVTDGFVVDVSIEANFDTHTFTFYALRDDGGGDFEYGTYTGNDSGARTISLADGSMVLDGVWVLRDNNSATKEFHKHTGMTGTDSFDFSNGLAVIDAITSIATPGQFSIDSLINASGDSFSYLAFAQNAASVQSIIYTGDDVDGRVIPTVFTAVVPHVRRFNLAARWRFRDDVFPTVDNQSLRYGGDQYATNQIQQILTNAIEVGDQPGINDLGDLHNMWLMKDNPVAAGPQFTGQIDAVSSIADAVYLNSRMFTGAIASASSIADAAMDLTRAFTGSIAAIATLTGVLTPTRFFSGSISSASTLADIELSVSVQRLFTGTISAQSSIAVAELTVGGVQFYNGTVVSVSDVSGTFTVIRNLSGSLTSASTLAGVLTPTRFFTGTITSSSTVDDSVLTVGAPVMYDGSLTSASTLAGNLTVGRKYAGSFTSVSTLAGNLTVTRFFAGSIASQSTVDDAVLTVGAVQMFTGSLTSASMLAGNLTVIRHYSGSIASVSTVGPGILTVQVGVLFSGLVASTSTLTGNISVGHKMSGTVLAVSTLFGSMSRVPALVPDHDNVWEFATVNRTWSL